ncbi:MAG TPA: hypothetical protein VFE54_14625 [Mucilaginibacter sp.]|nr:hypothetical protein [Mucilaginibacter sp.]
MSGMLAALCGHYYKLKMKLYKRDDRFKELFDNVLKFKQNRQISELDDILNSRNKAYSAYDKTLIAYEKVKETEDRIVQLLKMLGVRPNWILIGEVAGEMEYEVWYDEDDKVGIIKTKDLSGEVDEDIIILSGKPGGIMDDDDDDDDEEQEDSRKLLIYTRRTKENEAFFSSETKPDAEHYDEDDD